MLVVAPGDTLVEEVKNATSAARLDTSLVTVLNLEPVDPVDMEEEVDIRAEEAMVVGMEVAVDGKARLATPVAATATCLVIARKDKNVTTVSLVPKPSV